MLFEQSMHERDIPAVMKAVFRVAPYALWKKRWQEWADQEKYNPFLTDYFNNQFRIERAFEVTYDYYLSRHKVPRLDPDSYELFSFLALLVKVHDKLSEKGRIRLAGSVRDALQNTAGLVPVEIELRVAAHLMQKGFDVDFTDLEQRARFDLLASKAGMKIEVDCKSVSADVGRSIHARRFRDFAGRLSASIRQLAQHGGGLLVHITIPDNLHGDTRDLAAQTNSAISNALKDDISVELSPPVGNVRVRSFDLRESPFDQQPTVSETDLSYFLTKKLGLPENLNAVSHYVPRISAVVLVIESRRQDRVVDGIYRQLKDSALRQFSGNRPAVLCVRLRDVNAGQSTALAGEKMNGLAAIATRLLRADNRVHVAGISYISPSGALSTSVANAVQDRGTAYYFPNPDNPSEAMNQLFSG